MPIARARVQLARVRVRIRGAVQGVGFRPYVYRLARELALVGTVRNDSQGVLIDVEGPAGSIDALLVRLPLEWPPLAVIHSLESEQLEPSGRQGLVIETSDSSGDKSVAVLPDAATCPSCLAEILDPEDRRYGYAFTNCTDCGPRFSIIKELPYDRPNTTMRQFVMCPACEKEYRDPTDRRFHAQPNACPQCGPRLQLVTPEGTQLAEGDEVIAAAAAALRRGEILAAKGLGGFHLMVDATNAAAVGRLRERKARPAKPLALMVASVEQARRLCEIGSAERELLRSPQAPIVLLRRLPGATIAANVAPGNPWLGVMLPYTPLHHLLMAAVEVPVVATSGNLSDEPICIDNKEALERLGAIADLFLMHDRPVHRHVDDSVVRVSSHTIQPLRRARGLAPLPVLMSRKAPAVLAVGAHLKNTVALNVGNSVFVSQHIGDLETPQALAAFRAVIGDFLDLYEAEPVAIAHDLHPDYACTHWAQEAARASTSPVAGAQLIGVQHHHAHLASCLAEHQCAERVLGDTGDGTGLGPDGTIWGGEFLLGDVVDFTRVASLRRFRLPGGDAAIKRPAVVAAAMLWEVLGPEALERGDLAPIAALSTSGRQVLDRMRSSGLRSPWTTSAGRLFDGVAALLGLHDRVSFEGQAAMSLEFIADAACIDSYALPLEPPANPGEPTLLDWRPRLAAIIEDSRRGVAVETMAGKFHNGLAQAIAELASLVGESRVVLSGGCFQNQLLAERTSTLLQERGFEVLQHRQVPANDGGISLGQLAVAAARLRAGNSQEAQ
jgi:hydrogenase maturation protein HypF